MAKQQAKTGKPGATPRGSVEDHARAYEAGADSALPAAAGFSARLNMLLDLAAVVPPLNQGRVLAMLALNPAWRESELRQWLHKDVLPARLELHNLVKFLVARLQGKQDRARWEAFLVYGSPIVSSPINDSIYRADQARREIASMIFARITEEYGIPPSAYEADKVFQQCLTLMHKFNIYELRDFQPGHLEPFKNYLFPTA
jgi:hypothetical protein